MAFDDVRLPDDVERGARGGPRFQTTIVGLSSGGEQRNADWSQQRCEFNISWGIDRKEDYQAVIAFFYARMGRAIAFRFKDWSDYQAAGVNIGTGDGTTKTFQLRKLYGTYARKITRPVTGTLKVYVNGSLTSVSLGALGTFTFAAAPASGAVITADFEFDVPVRFESDLMQVELEWAGAGSIPDIVLLEVRE